MTKNVRNKKWKAAILDYDVLEAYSDDQQCMICLTPRQAIAILGYIRGMRWGTRWTNLPDDFDLDAWVSDIEDGLINVCCGNTDLRDCICNLQSVIRAQIDLQVAVDIPQPVIPPDNPGENLPAIDSTDPVVASRRDAFVCDLSKAWMSSVFDILYQGAVEYCANNEQSDDINWNNIVTAVGVVATLATITPVGFAAKALFFAATTAAAFSVSDELERYFDSQQSSDCGDIPRYSSAVTDAYGCQLWRSLFSGLSFVSFRGAFDDQQAETINQLVQTSGLSTSEAQLLDDEMRPLLQAFQAQGDAFKGFIQLIAEAAENPYYDGSLCADCVTINPTVETIAPWSDSRILVMQPAPTIFGSGDVAATWAAGTWSEIIISFDDYYKINSFVGDVSRGATTSIPGGLEYQINTTRQSVQFGPTGQSNVVLDFGGEIASYIVIRPRNANDLTGDLTLRMATLADPGFRVQALSP